MPYKKMVLIKIGKCKIVLSWNRPKEEKDVIQAPEYRCVGCGTRDYDRFRDGHTWCKKCHPS
jgi:hypothetical protein